jgi:hypothetical protein
MTGGGCRIDDAVCSNQAPFDAGLFFGPLLKMIEEPSQHAQFVEFARSIGADMDEETFKRAIGKIAKAPPKDSSKRR